MPNVDQSVGTCAAAANCHAEARAKRRFSLRRVPASNKLVRGLHIQGTRWRGLLLFLANSPSLRVTAAPRTESDRFAWWVHPGALGSRTSGCAQILDKEALAYRHRLRLPCRWQAAVAAVASCEETPCRSHRDWRQGDDKIRRGDDKIRRADVTHGRSDRR